MFTYLELLDSGTYMLIYIHFIQNKFEEIKRIIQEFHVDIFTTPSYM